MMRAVLLFAAAVSTSGCVEKPPSPPQPKPDNGTGLDSDARPSSWGDTLRQQNLANTMIDFIQGRDVPRSFSSLAQGPEFALGTVYVIKAKPGKACESINSDDFEDARLPDFRKRDGGCSSKVFEKQQRQDQTVKGSVKGTLDVVVGKGVVNSEHVYQLTFEDTSAVLTTPRECVDIDALLASSLPARTCVAKYIVGAVLTTVTWREFEKADASASGAYLSLVKVGLEMFGSSSSTTVTPVLSFDSVDLESFSLVETNNSGFLQIAQKARNQTTRDKTLKVLGNPSTLKEMVLKSKENRLTTMFRLELSQRDM